MGVRLADIHLSQTLRKAGALCTGYDPLSRLGSSLSINGGKVRPLRYEDFQKAMTVIRPSLSKSKWEELERWNEEFGSN
ncbi:hypothetical protein DVH24_026053 [Malus domestica]|uniref:Spastin/Vps4 C-terminal domain-containing protein n=1 Tax=Malus domestica TaxID=3750 RepID=A0A498KHL5_MALDO|nr:hypothetical protein DVH24_026053 [Malus domestica]